MMHLLSLPGAELDDDIRYLPDARDHPYHLEGDYLVIDSYDTIFIWNWKDDTVCTISDSDRRRWVRSASPLESSRD